MTRILIHGCGGKMGKVTAELAENEPEIEIAAGVDPIAAPEAFPFPVFASLEACDIPADVIVDFSVPETLGRLLDGAVSKDMPLIIATTGHTEEDAAMIQARTENIAIFQAANMSLGINLMADLIQKAAAVLGDGFDIEIVEKHHNQKKDAPSGTAYYLAGQINAALGNLREFIFGRHTRTERRKPQEIGIHAVRGGTIAGEHTVIFAGSDEVLEIRHSAHSRRIFAVGALRAARFMAGKPAGFYTMKDMIAAQDA